MLRTALQLYLNILPPPALILYFLHHDGTHRDLQQWIHTLRPTHLHCRLVFASDVTAYYERQKIILRLGKEFDSSVIEHICFSQF